MASVGEVAVADSPSHFIAALEQDDEVEDDAAWALEVAVREGDADRVRELLAAGLDPNVELDIVGTPTVNGAVDAGDLSVVSMFASFGADLVQSDDRGASYLSRAASTGDDSVALRTLLAAGSTPDVADRDGSTPLHCVAAYGYLRNAELLLAYGADPGAVTTKGLRAEEIAERSGHEMVAAVLRSSSGPQR
jgi:ankyrin